MGRREEIDRSDACPLTPSIERRVSAIIVRKEIIMVVGLSTVLLISALSTAMFWAPPPIGPEGPGRFDVLLLDVDQDGSLIQNLTYNTNIFSNHVPLWGKITELASGGFAIAGFHEIDEAYSNADDRQLWVIRTDENYNTLWNRTYGRTAEVRAITEMNNGDLAIGHYIEGYEDYGGIGPFQILVIDDEGKFVRERSWRFGWCSGFSHCDDGGFILAKEIYDTAGSPFWIARIDTELNIIWNKTYPSFASGTNIIEDTSGGFTVPSEPGLDGPIGIVRLDNQGDETSRVFTNSTRADQRLWLTQCSNGEYLGWADRYILRFNIEGEILWERYEDFDVHGVLELSPNRIVAFEKASSPVPSLGRPGVRLDCFNASGNTLWSRSIPGTYGDRAFFVPDVISTSDGRVIILGLVDPHQLPSVPDFFPDAETVAMPRDYSNQMERRE